ncbi:hypothetical protein J6590_002811 [Homalodisca vitripennis]|nr:hypothetical protein J6590_002811 [Homalodisca vitripennis]
MTYTGFAVRYHTRDDRNQIMAHCVMEKAGNIFTATAIAKSTDGECDPTTSTRLTIPLQAQKCNKDEQRERKKEMPRLQNGKTLHSARLETSPCGACAVPTSPHDPMLTEAKQDKIVSKSKRIYFDLKPYLTTSNPSRTEYLNGDIPPTDYRILQSGQTQTRHQQTTEQGVLEFNNPPPSSFLLHHHGHNSASHNEISRVGVILKGLYERLKGRKIREVLGRLVTKGGQGVLAAQGRGEDLTIVTDDCVPTSQGTGFTLLATGASKITRGGEFYTGRCGLARIASLQRYQGISHSQITITQIPATDGKRWSCHLTLTDCNNINWKPRPKK